MSLLRQALIGTGLLAAIAGAFWWMQHRLDAAQSQAHAAAQRNIQLTAALKAARADTRIVTRYVDRVHTVHQRGRTIVQKVPVYVPPSAAHRCVVNRGFVRLHDAAAEGVDLPASPSSIDAPAPGITLPGVARTVVHNYTTCHAIAQQLTALQKWVRVHSLPATGPP